MADKLIFVTREELLEPQTNLAWLFGYPQNQTKVVIPELLVFDLMSKITQDEGISFEIKLMSNTKQISDNICDSDYPILIHNQMIIERQNIIRYLKKISFGLFKPKK